MRKIGLVLFGLVLGFVVALGGAALAAWPTTPLTTYVANSPPAIKAADLNAFQSAINGAFLGTYSYRGLVVDGTGGNSVTPVAGSLKVSRSVASGTTPTSTVALGELTKGTTPVCWAVVNGTTGAIFRGANLWNTTRTAAGDYLIDCNVGLNDNANGAAIVTTLGTSRIGAAFTTDNGGGLVQIHVKTASGVGGALADSNFSVVLFGE